ncbi:hypothetical protein D3H35_20430 [Cohnella faecalis]|uniref:Uncharacterized protein n=2 Tax=Cohnella faecalis TaxID=2315694 RepID=A0A398CL85_9BACL|nr:hypothetical protein D3H35_20430 [Cohnella faecalis]
MTEGRHFITPEGVIFLYEIFTKIDLEMVDIEVAINYILVRDHWPEYPIFINYFQIREAGNLKKLFSLLAAAVLCLSFSTSVFAHSFEYSTTRDNVRTQVYTYSASHSHSSLLLTTYSWDNTDYHPSISVLVTASGHDHYGTLSKFAASSSSPYHYWTSSYCYIDTTFTGFYKGYVYDLV